MKHLILLCITLLLSTMVFCQDIVYYYGGDFRLLNSSENASYKNEISQKSGNKTRITTYELQTEEWEKIKTETVKRLNDSTLQIKRSGEKLFKETIIRNYRPVENNLFFFTDRINGIVSLQGSASNISPLHKQGHVNSYWSAMRPKSYGIYDNNRLISNENWLKNGSKYFSNLHYFVDQIPEHSMGQTHFRAYMMNGIKESGIDLGQISDKVLIGWVVTEEGTLEGFHTISGVFSQLNNTLISLIKNMPGEWIPAKISGMPVKYYMVMPFNFIDRSESFESLEFNTGFVVWD